ncbi:MAG: gamma-glutamyltransferase [Thermodesulfobacteriota bacterium]|nr:MAG: gamma-glutamyltransferase [Thermodesulfobacteriota bacterium]
MTNIALKTIYALITIITLIVPAQAQDNPLYSGKSRFHPVVAKNGMVASENKYATQAGLQVLKEGGNAVDAAVTIGFTMAVTFPRAGNLGGGGFMLVYLADKNEVISIDYREKAPLQATRDMFLDKEGNVDKEKSRHSILSAGVPGTVAGLALALERYGTISLKRALQPAIELAQKGFPVDYELSKSLSQAKSQMERSPASMKIFYKQNGEPYKNGEILTQENLAWSLKQIAQKGPQTFYNGDIAQKIASFMKQDGGLITSLDLKSYKAVTRKPVEGEYRGYKVYSMPPPSSGGVHLIQMLNVLEQFPLSSFGHNTSKTIHIFAETMKHAYADRSKYLGDPDFSPIPVSELTSKQYAELIKEQIDMEQATPSNKILPGDVIGDEGANTTHFSVMDSEGNAVSNTYTLNFSYGSKITVPGTGILLNNEMDDFSAKPGNPNAYGLVGGKLNAIAPEKRMLSSMSPTIVMKDGNPFLITGSPGGSRIITTVLQIILNVIDFNMNISEATNSVRVHHQWLPDVLNVETGLNEDTISLLRKMGYKVEIGRTIGVAESIIKDEGFMYGASDPRRPGGLTEGY